MNSGDLRQSGIIKTWDDDKGFGFIEISGRRKDVFFHISAVETDRRRPKEGDEVIYILEEGSEKKPKAEAVWLRGEPVPPETCLHRLVRTRFVWRAASIPIYFVHCLVLHLVWGAPLAGFAWIVFSSGISFSLYVYDKSEAGQGRRRIPEAALIGWGAVGGWPGGLLAQMIFWHKTTKRSFQSLFWITVILNFIGTAVAAYMLRGIASTG